MGKLSIKVHGCHIHQPSGRTDITPRVAIVVDNTYRFKTHSRKHTYEPNFNETFVVGNTHRLAVIEVSVYDVVESRVNIFAALAVDASATYNNHSRSLGAGGPADADPDDDDDAAGGQTEMKLVGRCYISIQRLVQGRPKQRTYVLGTPLPVGNAAAAAGGGGLFSDSSWEAGSSYTTMPAGVAGTVTITLASDSLGESASALRLNDAAEEHFAQRLKRLLLRYDKPKLQVMDLIMAGVRDSTEKLGGGGPSRTTTTPKDPRRNNAASVGTPLTSTAGENGNDNGGGSAFQTLIAGLNRVIVSLRHPSLNFYQARGFETFDRLMDRLCAQYGGYESNTFRVVARVDGCTNLDKKGLNTALLGSDDVYVILRTESEDYVTGSERLQSTVVWTEANETVLDVENPNTFVIHVVLMGRASVSKHYEIGRTTVSVAALSLEHLSERHLYLCTFDNLTLPVIAGNIHLSLRPLNFGLTPIDSVAQIDEFYDRLSRFFRRYDPVRVPQVDTLVHARLGELEEFMQDLIVKHGREPGSVRLLVTVDRIAALQEAPGVDMNEREVRVLVTMGGTAVRTKASQTFRFVETVVNEGYRFDVVRETDMIRLEVVKASDDTVVYGRVDFTCLNIQREADNARRLYLVGNAGTAGAFISGIVTVTLQSDAIGVDYKVDEQVEVALYGRLRRYAFRRIPESLHRVSLAVATVFDMESFIAQLSVQYGAEDPTLALFFTVTGCRQLKSRFTGVSPYVVVRVGIDSYRTKYVKGNTEPDFFEFCEFFFDRPADHYVTLIVMDRSDIGDDREIGRAVISLRDVALGQQYHDYLPLMPPPTRRELNQLASNYNRQQQQNQQRQYQQQQQGQQPGGGSVKSGASVRMGLLPPDSADAPSTATLAGGADNNTSNSGVLSSNLLSPGQDGKHRTLGLVGFKYVVVNMNGVDLTRCRLVRKRAMEEGFCPIPPTAGDLTGYRTVEGTTTANFSSTNRNSLRNSNNVSNSYTCHDGHMDAGNRSPAEASLGRRAGSVSVDGDDDVSSSGTRSPATAATAPASGWRLSGWMEKFKGFTKSVEAGGKTAINRVSAGGGASVNGNNSSPRKSAGSGSPATGDLQSAGVASVVHSEALVPSWNLMDEGVMDLGAFAPSYGLSANQSFYTDGEGPLGGSVNSGGGGGNASNMSYNNCSTTVNSVRGEFRMGSERPLSRGASMTATTTTGVPRRQIDRTFRDDDDDECGEELNQLLAQRSTAVFMPYGGGGGMSGRTGSTAVFDEREFPPLMSDTSAGVRSPGSPRAGGGGAAAQSPPERELLVPVDTGPRMLHLRIMSCRDLRSAGKNKPSPYLLFSSIHETHRTRMEFNTCNPRYNEEYCIRVDDDTASDFIEISALSDTPYGSKQLGHCVLSMRNVQRGEWHTRWASFVAHSHKSTAFVHGSLCISVMGENFGLEYLPSTDAENRLRERIRDFLVAVAPAQLHRLEWFVGELSGQEAAGADALTRLFGTYYSQSSVRQSATVAVNISAITKLCIDGVMVYTGSCAVKVKSGKQTLAKTRTVHGENGTFRFDETLTFTLLDPATTPVRFSVSAANGREKAGETFASLQDLHKGVPKARTLVLSINARGLAAGGGTSSSSSSASTTTAPKPSGLLSASILSHDYGSSSVAPTVEEDAGFYRLQRFLFYYRPEAVAMADVKYAATLNPHTYLGRLVRRYGPEPGEFRLRLTVSRCLDLHQVAAKEKVMHPFCVVRCGLDEYRSAIVEGGAACAFHESFQVTVGVPSHEKVELILFHYSPSKCVEFGRTQVPLTQLNRGQPNELRLPLVTNAGTRMAQVNGLVELSALTADFGKTHFRTNSTAWFYPDDGAGSSSTPGGAALLSSSPSGADLSPPAAAGASAEERGAKSTPSSRAASGTDTAFNVFGRVGKGQHARGTSRDAFGGPGPRVWATAGRTGSQLPTFLPVADEPASRPSTTTTPAVAAARALPPSTLPGTAIRVTLCGFGGLKQIPEHVEMYVRVTSKSDTLIKTKPIPVSQLGALHDGSGGGGVKEDKFSFDVDAQALLTDRVFTLKLGRSSLLGNDTVCYADFYLTWCVPGVVSEKRLRLYEHKTHVFLGIARLSVDISRGAAAVLREALAEVDPLGDAITELVMDDMASLLATYSPHDLRKLALGFYRSADIRKLHRSLRLQLCPSVVATVYLVVHDIKLHLGTGPTSLVFKHACTVTASVGTYTAEVIKRSAASALTSASPTVLACGNGKPGAAEWDFCPIRVDISETGPAAVLTVCVSDRQSPTKCVELARATVSLRALLSTPTVYDMGEHVSVPLVEQRREANRVHASMIGTMTFSLYPPAYEAYPSSVRFPTNRLEGSFNKAYMRYYGRRIYRFLKNYDANSCVDLHAQFYERFVPTGTWRDGPPRMLRQLVEKWGPELEDPGEVPPL